MNTRLLMGLEVGKLESNKLIVSPGSLQGWSGVGLDYPVATTVDLGQIGCLNGADAVIVPGDLFLYAIHSDTEAGFLASQSKIAGGVTVPAGFTLCRKLPWGVVYSPTWGGIPDIHVTHWPSPLITLTHSEATAEYCALSIGAAEDWTDVDLSPWIPDNARLAFLMARMKWGGGVSGSSYLRSYSEQTTGQLVGSVSSSCGFQTMTTMIRVSSTRKIQYKNNSSGAKLSLYILGYAMTEPA